MSSLKFNIPKHKLTEQIEACKKSDNEIIKEAANTLTDIRNSLKRK